MLIHNRNELDREEELGLACVLAGDIIQSKNLKRPHPPVSSAVGMPNHMCIPWRFCISHISVSKGWSKGCSASGHLTQRTCQWMMKHRKDLWNEDTTAIVPSSTAASGQRGYINSKGQHKTFQVGNYFKRTNHKSTKNLKNLERMIQLIKPKKINEKNKLNKHEKEVRKFQKKAMAVLLENLPMFVTRDDWEAIKENAEALVEHYSLAMNHSTQDSTRIANHKDPKVIAECMNFAIRHYV